MKWTIEAIRKQLGYTQAEMAKQLKLSVVSYCNKEQKKVEWKGSELNTISILSNIKVDDMDYC